MSRSSSPHEGAREWVSGLVVIVATVVAFIGFARASLLWTIVISAMVWAGLIMFLWSVGAGKKRGRGKRRSRTQHSRNLETVADRKPD